MATQLDPNVKDDLKTQFVTREGTYRLLTLSEYSRPNRVGYTNNQSSPQVRVSLVTLPNPALNNGSGAIGSDTTNAAARNSNTTTITTNTTTTAANNRNTTNSMITTISSNGGATVVVGNGCGDGNNMHHHHNTNYSSGNSVPSTMDARLGAGISMHSMMNGTTAADQNNLSNPIYGGDRICFNFGRELYVYAFRGIKKCTELSKPIDKKFYKGTHPSCHDFNATVATPTGAPLLVGFTTGQIQLVSPQPGPRELRKLFNEERLIDKTKVTCLKWLPNSPNLFLASHASGHLYLYNEDLPCTATSPNYQPFKVGDGYTILTCKSKSTRNPLYKWVFSTDNCCINEFCFSPCGSNLALVSQDGFLRVFHYDTMELLGIARSYFGGFLCVCWSPDGKYIVVGGEDDLVTIWSLHERRVVARGQGHRSWVSVVAFDPYTTSYTNWDSGDFSDDENPMHEYTSSREARLSNDSTAGNGFDFDKNSTPLQARQPRPHSASFRSDASSAALAPDKLAISYRLGSVSQDTQICLWDITEDVLRHPLTLRQRVNSTNIPDTSYMNGGIDADGVKVLRPLAIGNFNSNTGSSYINSPTKCDPTNATEHSNSSSSKFSTANCTISSQSSNANTPPDETDAVPTTATTTVTATVTDVAAAPAAPTITQTTATATTATITAAAAVTTATTTTTTTTTTKNNKSHTSSNSIKFPNCISATKSDSIESSASNRLKGGDSGSLTKFSMTTGYNSKSSNSSSKYSESGSSISAFNSLTQRLTNFNFLSSDKKSATISGGTFDGSGTHHRQQRKAISLLKSYNQHNHNNSNHNQAHNHSSNFGNAATPGTAGHDLSAALKSNNGGSGGGINSFGSLKLNKNLNAVTQSMVVTSYDPMKLIGTPACPRFDECPLLEPLVCKKIAHERLTSLIFREDCFLTACQDGFIYTWARPGYATNVAQHLSPSQIAPTGGTVI